MLCYNCQFVKKIENAEDPGPHTIVPNFQFLEVNQVANKSGSCGVLLNIQNGYSTSERLSFRLYCRKCDYKIHKKYSKKWFKDHPGYGRDYKKIEYRKDPAKFPERSRLNRAKIKLDVLSRDFGYPPSCANPFGIHLKPFRDIRWLTLDHVNGNERQQRIQLGISGGWLH